MESIYWPISNVYICIFWFAYRAWPTFPTHFGSNAPLISASHSVWHSGKCWHKCVVQPLSWHGRRCCSCICWSCIYPGNSTSNCRKFLQAPLIKITQMPAPIAGAGQDGGRRSEKWTGIAWQMAATRASDKCHLGSHWEKFPTVPCMKNSDCPFWKRFFQDVSYKNTNTENNLHTHRIREFLVIRRSLEGFLRIW